jgi:NAD(P)-dependent dehydrogenase (short-subunit alcohol dehydrogenase family)
VLLPTIQDHPPGGLDPEDEAAVGSALGDMLDTHGRIDILVYAVSAPGAYPLIDMTLGQWDRLHGANLRGAFVVVREAVKRMIPGGGGRIIAISTMGAFHPVLNGNAAYGSSKAGLNALMRSVALDYAKDGILANAIAPGAVPVGPMPADAPPSAGPAFQPGRMLLGMGSAKDIAAGALYLASPAGRFMTGQVLVLDGGFLVS